MQAVPRTSVASKLRPAIAVPWVGARGLRTECRCTSNDASPYLGRGIAVPRRRCRCTSNAVSRYLVPAPVTSPLGSPSVARRAQTYRPGMRRVRSSAGLWRQGSCDPVARDVARVRPCPAGEVGSVGQMPTRRSPSPITASLRTWCFRNERILAVSAESVGSNRDDVASFRCSRWECRAEACPWW